MSTMAMFVSRARKKKKIKRSEMQKEALPQIELGEDSNLQQFVCMARRGQNRLSGLLLAPPEEINSACPEYEK